MEEKIKFPLKFEKCPACKCPEIITGAVKEYFNIKRVEGEPEQALTCIQTPVASRGEMVMNITVPWIDAYLNICPKCGIVYCCLAELSKKPASGK